MIILTNKRYSQETKKVYDPISKEITKEIMGDVCKAKFLRENLEEDAGSSKDGYWDQEYIHKENIIIVEAEMKNGIWFGENHGNDCPFKYTGVDIPLRKDKNKSQLYFVISYFGDIKKALRGEENYMLDVIETKTHYAFACTRKALQTAGRAKKPCSNNKEGEFDYFYRVNVENGLFLMRRPWQKWELWQPN